MKQIKILVLKIVDIIKLVVDVQKLVHIMQMSQHCGITNVRIRRYVLVASWLPNINLPSSVSTAGTAVHLCICNFVPQYYLVLKLQYAVICHLLHISTRSTSFSFWSKSFIAGQKAESNKGASVSASQQHLGTSADLLVVTIDITTIKYHTNSTRHVTQTHVQFFHDPLSPFQCILRSDCSESKARHFSTYVQILVHLIYRQINSDDVFKCRKYVSCFNKYYCKNMCIK